MNKQKENILLLIGTLQSSIIYLDYALDTKIFGMDLKFSAQNTLKKVEKWFETYYKLNKGEVEEVASQIDILTTIYEKSAKIAFQLNEKGEVEADKFMDEFEDLVKRYNIEL